MYEFIVGYCVCVQYIIVNIIIKVIKFFVMIVIVKVVVLLFLEEFRNKNFEMKREIIVEDQKILCCDLSFGSGSIYVFGEDDLWK